MMTLETRVEIHVLHRQGMSIRAIARQLSCSRETVRRYIRSPLPVADMRYKPRMPRTCKLDPFKPYVLERVAAARPQWIPASVLLREIGQRGYDGGYSMLTAFLHPMKQPVTEAVTRFETEPGVQMQVDFTIVRQGHNPLLAFVATLGWSRATFVKFYSNQESAAWCDGIESALKFFGGTPHQLLFDNAKALCQTMLFTRWSHTFRTSSGRRFPLTLHLKSSVAVCTWNSVYLSARIRYIAISCRRDRLAGSYISNFLIGENVTGTMPKTSNQALFPTVLVLSIAQLKPSLNRSLATSKLTLFLAKTRSHSC